MSFTLFSCFSIRTLTHCSNCLLFQVQPKGAVNRLLIEILVTPLSMLQPLTTFSLVRRHQWINCRAVKCIMTNWMSDVLWWEDMQTFHCFISWNTWLKELDSTISPELFALPHACETQKSKERPKTGEKEETMEGRKVWESESEKIKKGNSKTKEPTF